MKAAIRRVVTGHTKDRKSTVLIDGILPSTPSAHEHFIWTTGSTPADNSGSSDAAQAPHRLEPEANGSMFRVVEIPPKSILAGLSAEQKENYFRDVFAGLDASHCRVDTSRSPGMHKTSTIDYVMVLRGEITLLLDEGEATLNAGDVVVQRGTNHDWVVRGSEPAVIAVVMLSAQPV
jgi:mannose-6-phosphate isomerase-like protein (cupin superfamily)